MAAEPEIATRSIFVIGGTSGSSWVHKIAESDPEAIVFWVKAPQVKPDSVLTIIDASGGSEALLMSRLAAMAKRGNTVVYVDMMMRSARVLIPFLRDEGIEATPIRSILQESAQ